MGSIAEVLAEAYAEWQFRENGVFEKTSMVNGVAMTMFSPDGQHWFSCKRDIQRWQAAQAKIARDHHKAMFNPKTSRRGWKALY